MIVSPVPFFHCPSRRSAILYPHVATYQNRDTLFDPNAPLITEWPKESAKSDYAANAGDKGGLLSGLNGPNSLLDGDTTFRWNRKRNEAVWGSMGICFPRSEVRIRDISDGTTNTILVGEKFVRLQNYDQGYGSGDDQNLYAGFNSDTFRTTDHVPMKDYWDPVNSDVGDDWFGSAHPGGANFAMCDGSVHVIKNEVTLEVYKGMGNRKDKKPTTDPFQ